VFGSRRDAAGGEPGKENAKWSEPETPEKRVDRLVAVALEERQGLPARPFDLRLVFRACRQRESETNRQRRNQRREPLPH